MAEEKLLRPESPSFKKVGSHVAKGIRNNIELSVGLAHGPCVIGALR